MFDGGVKLKEKPMHAVFISDLHLEPQQDVITQRFFRFLDWVTAQTDTLYILGDFFHAWPGDDALDEWARTIAERLKALSHQGVTCYFMPGNRDFLLGKQFAALAKWTQLPDPYVLQIEGTRILLSHGDRYCTADRAHQWFRRFTRNSGFRMLFSWIPLSLRKKWVHQVRTYSSMNNQKKSNDLMDVVEDAVVKSMEQAQATVLIHGHVHVPQQYVVKQLHRFVLSDWDDTPTILCYYKSHGFKLTPFN